MPCTIWIDADALPNKNREVLLKAILKHNLPAQFVANRWIDLPRRSHIKMKVVSQGFDKADEYIAERCTDGDLIITADIPLANDCIQRGAKVLTPRGRELTKMNIGPALAARNMREDMRNSGMIEGGGPPPMNNKDIQAFSNGFDRWVRKQR